MTWGPRLILMMNKDGITFSSEMGEEDGFEIMRASEFNLFN